MRLEIPGGKTQEKETTVQKNVSFFISKAELSFPKERSLINSSSVVTAVLENCVESRGGEGFKFIVRSDSLRSQL